MGGVVPKLEVVHVKLRIIVWPVARYVPTVFPDAAKSAIHGSEGCD